MTSTETSKENGKGKPPGKKAAAGVKKPAGKKVEVEAKKPAKASKSNGEGKKGRKSLYDDGAKIKLLVKENPHRTGTKCFNMFAKYQSGMTVGEVVAKGVPYSNVRYLVGLGHIKVG